MPKFYTYKKDVPLAPGQKLQFTAGRGYYAAGIGVMPPPTSNTSGARAYVNHEMFTPMRPKPGEKRGPNPWDPNSPVQKALRRTFRKHLGGAYRSGAV